MLFSPAFCSTSTLLIPNKQQRYRGCESRSRTCKIYRRPSLKIRATADTPSFPPNTTANTTPTKPLTPIAKLVRQLETLRQFSRPHTVIGTILAVLSLHVVAWRTAWVSMIHAAYLFVIALVPALAMNVFIVGLNQIHDIPIDTVNKPHLPLPAGRLSLRDAYRIISIALIIGVAFCWAPGADISLQVVLIGSALLGAIYSAPPFRLKRWPIAASACILAVRGFLVNSCFYWHASQTFMLPIVLRFAVLFFVVFGIVIALLKDVPDIPGDRVYGIGTIAVRAGPYVVFRFCVSILSSAFVFAAFFFYLFGASTPLNYAASALQLVTAITIVKKSIPVDPADEKQAYRYYMFTWKCFYLQYLLLPMAF